MRKMVCLERAQRPPRRATSSTEEPPTPLRINDLRDTLRGYERSFPVPRAFAAARRRIIDACAIV